MSYSKQQKESAYMVWKECGSITQTSEILQIPLPTISSWCNKLKWEFRKNNEVDPPQETDFDDEIDTRNLPAPLIPNNEDERKTLENIRQIENICVKSIIGERKPKQEDKKEDEEETGLRPKDIREAMAALKICWDTRRKIFDSVAPERVAAQGGQTINMLQIVRKTAVQESPHDTFEIQEENSLPGPVRDFKRTRGS